MATVDKIRNGLIDKLLTINNKDFLEALDKLISSSINSSKTVKLTADQKKLLEMSDRDVQEGQLISQEAMNKRNLRWLNEL